ncbi:MAG: phosphate ABC transporter permease PstA, partial [Devosia nanyangense]|nr:phosphate ABC transporter permease PstA [Devosia nanyangense]
MTDQIMSPIASPVAKSIHTTSDARDRLKKRYRSEANFKAMGVAALSVAIVFLVVLLSSIAWKGAPAFVYNFASLPMNASAIDRTNLAAANYDALVKQSVRDQFPELTARADTKILNSLMSSGAPILLRDRVVADPTVLDRPGAASLPISDFADLYLKGQIAASAWTVLEGAATVAVSGEEVTIAVSGEAFAPALAALPPAPDAAVPRVLNSGDPSLLLYAGNTVIKLKSLAASSATGTVIVGAIATPGLSVDKPRLRTVLVPEASRKFSDKEMVFTDVLVERGFITTGFNWIFATRGASREAEMAGILGAVLGSALTLVVTLALAFPVGVAAAMYLEEFAPRNRWTTFIEVNINNLAAVPSIVFGLLGLAVFLNFFGFERSAPYVGGFVLALMTLPTIIIASRVALRSVPPSIREGALGIGASKLQMVIDHVLPLAMPGVLTGAIIGMARALGETAPLLMIGMVAFVVDLTTTFA